MFSESNDLVTKLDVVTKFDLFSSSERLSQIICKECGILMEDTYYSEYLAPSHFGLAYVVLLKQVVLKIVKTVK